MPAPSGIDADGWPSIRWPTAAASMADQVVLHPPGALAHMMQIICTAMSATARSGCYKFTDSTSSRLAGLRCLSPFVSIVFGVSAGYISALEYWVHDL